MDEVADKGLLLLGCGKMGSAMLEGWLGQGLPADRVTVIDPHPSDWLKGVEGLRLNDDPETPPGIALIAVKPQVMAEALPRLGALGGGGTLILTVAAGTPIRVYEEAFGPGTPVIRAMPNTPAAIGRGITALIGNAEATEAHMALAEGLLSAVGQTVRLADEAQMDAVTAVSGSGPAYVFHMIEALTEAGIAEGLAPGLALQLARATVAGAGALAEETGEAPATLRRNVTSPNGTTQAGLEVLMAEEGGLPDLMRRTVAAAARRSRELGQ